MPPKPKLKSERPDPALAGHPTSLRIPKELLADIDVECERVQRSRNALIVMILKQWQAYWKKVPK